MNLLLEKIKVVYEQYPIKYKMRFTEVFSLLTAPVHLSFINEAETSLMKIALQTNKKDRTRLISEHQKKYFWINNNYLDDTILTEDYFEKELNMFITHTNIK